MDIVELRAAAAKLEGLKGFRVEGFIDKVEDRWNAEHAEEQKQSVVTKDIPLAQLKEQAGDNELYKEFVAGLSGGEQVSKKSGGRK